MDDTPASSNTSRSMKSALQSIFSVASIAESLFDELWKTHGLTLAQVRLLLRIRQHPMVAGDLAKELGVRATSLTRMVERLEAIDLVERKLDHQDRRRILVSITETGRSILSGLGTFREEPLFKALEAMTDTERDDLTQRFESFVRLVRDAETDSRTDII